MDTGNFSRVDKITYPDGSTFEHKYGASSTSDYDISRAKTIRDTSEFAPVDIVRYDYIGLGMIGVTDYEDIDVQLDRTASHGGQRQTEGNTKNLVFIPALIALEGYCGKPG